MTAAVARNCVARAVAALRAAQHPDGHWEDFALPVGRATAWVTAYVGLALAEHAAQVGDAAARAAAARAAAWLVGVRGEPGWGYNARTGTDADSTAHALLLLRRFGIGVPEASRWLREAWRPDGCATYRRADAWGIAHPCVTPTAYLALEPEDQIELADVFQRCVLAARNPDGSWRAYWWETPHYSSFVNALALARSALGTEPPPARADLDSIDGTFDLACLAGVALLADRGAEAHALIDRIARHERAGWWAPSVKLRVTEPDCYEPWVRPAGRVFTDVDGVFTTATVVRALSQVPGAA